MAAKTAQFTGKRIEDVKLGDLLLDQENPRFAGVHLKNSQKDIAKNLWEEMHLDELIFSLAFNGYYRQEPLLVIPKEGSDKFIVVEGNRRLASIKILLDSQLSKHVGARSEDMPKVTKERLKELQTIPVIKYQSRKELWSYLSYRHVNGPRSWSSISKAEYVAMLHKEMSIDFDEIIKNTGDRNRTSLKLYNGLMVLRQGETMTKFSRDDFDGSKLNFSHLYTILQYPNAKKFLGIENLDPKVPYPADPVDSVHKKELEELLVWLFGSKSRKRPSLIRSQNPDLSNLDDVLGNVDSLDYLRETNNLIEAHELTSHEDRRLEAYVSRTQNNLRRAKGVESAYKGDKDLLTKMENIKDISSEMHKKWSKKKRKQKDSE